MDETRHGRPLAVATKRRAHPRLSQRSWPTRRVRLSIMVSLFLMRLVPMASRLAGSPMGKRSLAKREMHS